MTLKTLKKKNIKLYHILLSALAVSPNTAKWHLAAAEALLKWVVNYLITKPHLQVWLLSIICCRLSCATKVGLDRWLMKIQNYSAIFYEVNNKNLRIYIL